MMSTGNGLRYCARCGARLARDNPESMCRPCHHAAYDLSQYPPQVPPDFWDNDRLKDALARERHIGHAVQAYRKHPFHGKRPVPQEVAARWLNVSQAQLSRIENGRPVFDLDRLVQWATILQIPPGLLWFKLPDERGDVRHHETVAASLPLRALGKTDLGEIDSLRQRIEDSLSRGAMSDASLEDWEQAAIRYARATRDRPALILVADLGRDLAELNRIRNQQRSVSVLRRLTRVTAQMSGLMCLEFCILDDRPAFRGWARTARLAAKESGDPETLSWILAQEAYGNYYSGDILEAIEVARHAYEIVKAPCTGAALASALEARAQATLGRQRETRDALARAENCLTHLDGDVLVPSAFGYNEGYSREPVEMQSDYG